jgi:hypothetical protein
MTDKEKKNKIADILMDFQEEYSNEVINRPMLASLYAGDILSFIDSLQEKPATKDFEAALAEEWKGYNDRGAAKVDALEDNTQELAFAKGFYRGWHHPKSSVWHDAREEPEEGKDFAFVTYNGIMWARYRIEDIFLGWQRYRVQTELDKWAYVSDLLKL